ncbi:MAG TPA: GAF domain-containing protein, partial [Geobacteraceae bacterium]|nr:GAF domain-containing protein [Geobacteraceae bacterium]
MESASEYREPFDINEAAAQLLLDIAHEQSIETLAEKIVNNAQPPSDFIQIWLVDKGDRCPSCPFRNRCPDQRRCLHFMAAAGRSLTGQGSPAGFGAHEARLPLGEGLIGQAAQKAQTQLFEGNMLSSWTELLGMNNWLEKEQIRSMAATPIVFMGEVLG